MKKKVFNVFYISELKFTDKDGLTDTEQLGLFEDETDAELALNLMFNVKDFLNQQLGVSLIREGAVIEQLILEEQTVPYYKSLLEFALNNVTMKEYAKQNGFAKVEKMVEETKTKHNAMYNE